MEKCLIMRAGQTPVQKYWKKLLDMIQVGVCKRQEGRPLEWVLEAC